jgi:hypothetical protein
MFLPIGGYEASILWRFLDGVSAAISKRMVLGSSPGEENLTFLLCELLDANATSLHALPYPLSQAQAHLQSSDSGITIEVEFQTHDHSKHFESRYSGADLGVVLAVDHPILGRSRRGILIQAKRLFASGRAREYGLYSGYDSFERRQAEFLKALQERFSVWNSSYYLWYNPPSTAFPEPDAKILRAYDSSGPSPHQYWHRMHPFLDELIDMGLPWLLTGGSVRTEPSVEEVGKIRQWRLTQPALRVSALDVALSVGENGPPRLKALYEATLERRSDPAFAPFADFLLIALASSRYGSDKAEWLRLTEGQKVTMPAPRDTNQKRSDLDELDSPPIPRHTLHLTIRSTLPQVG